MPPGAQREASALCHVFLRPVLSLWTLPVSGLGGFKPPEPPFDLRSCGFHSTPLRSPRSFQASPAAFLKNRSLFLRWLFSFPCACGTKAVCGVQGLPLFSLWNLLDLWQVRSQIGFWVSNIILSPPSPPSPWGMPARRRPAMGVPHRPGFHPPAHAIPPPCSALEPSQHFPEGPDSAHFQGFPSGMWFPTYNHHVASTPSLPNAHLLAKGSTLTAATHRGFKGPQRGALPPALRGTSDSAL